MLKINLISVGVAAIVTFLTIEVLHNLNAAIFSIVFLYAFRCEMAEHYMEHILQLKLKKAILAELFMAVIFITTSVLLDNWLCTIIYAVAYLGYMIANKNRVVAVKRMMRR